MGSQKHLQRESRSWKLDRPWRHLAGVSGAFPHVHVKSSCRASDSSLMYPHVPTTPHVCTTPMPSARWVTCCWGGGQELWDVFFVGERWFFSSNQERVRTSWCHERSKSSLLFLLFFFLAFDQTKQVFGNCCVGKATGVFWNQALSCRGYFCHTSRGFD